MLAQVSPGTRRALHQCLYSSTTIHLLHNRENVILEKSEQENIWMLHPKVNPTLLTSFKLPCIMFSRYYSDKIFLAALILCLKTMAILWQSIWPEANSSPLVQVKIECGLLKCVKRLNFANELVWNIILPNERACIKCSK